MATSGQSCTIEDGKLWILQTRSAKRTPRAALRIAIDLVAEKLITPAEALRRLESADLNGLVRKTPIDPPMPLGLGTGASPGVAIGRAAFSSESAERLASNGETVILIRPDTSTADVAGFAASAGIVTAAGGRTAHAALVARQMGKPCIAGCTALTVDAAAPTAKLGDTTPCEGDWLSIDGNTGAIYPGRCAVAEERPEAELAQLARWRSEALQCA